jgi:hypothetical protein
MKGVASSYQPAVAIFNERNLKSIATVEGNPHKVVSVNLGSHKQNFVSETKQMFQGRAPETKDNSLH